MFIHRFAKRLAPNDTIIEDTRNGVIRYVVKKRSYDKNGEFSKLTVVAKSSSGLDITFLFDSDDIVLVEIIGTKPDPLSMLKSKAA